MLVLTRKVGERIMIGSDIAIEVVVVDRSRVKLGIEAPKDLPIERPDMKCKTPKARSK